tara:strand:- start:944 stop:1063 length:120 start_codon:yes stop_codon:yes gene_type:complete
MCFLEMNKGFLLNKKLGEVRGGVTTYANGLLLSCAVKQV